MTIARALPSVAAMRRAVAANSVPVLVTTLATTNLLRIVSNLVLTRLLAPEAFGVVGVIASISFVLQMLTDMGFHPFIVRSRNADSKHFIDVIWTIRLVRSAVLAALMFAFAGPLAAAFDKPDLATPIMAASFLFLLEGARSMHPISAERARRISYVMIVEFGVFLVTTALTIAAAFALGNYWALIAGMYAGALVNVAFSYALFPGGAHAIAFDRLIGRELWAFARIVVASSVITMILGQADKIFIGRTLTLEEFGLYMLAVTLTGAALRLVSSYVHKVLFPLLAETGRTAPETLAALYYDSRRRMTLVLAFLLGGVVGGGPLAVRILFDERYLAAGPYVSLLALAPLFSLITMPAEQIVIVMGRVKSALEANIVRLAYIALAAPLGLYLNGTLGLVAAFALIEAAAACYWWRRLGKFSILNWREEGAPLLLALVGAMIGFGLYQLAEYLIATGALAAF